MAANSSTVPLVTPAARMISRFIRCRQPDAVAHSTSAAMTQNRTMPWIMAGMPARLDLAAGQDERPEQDRRDDHAERVEPGEVRDDHAREAVAGREAVLEPVHDAADLGHAGQARPAHRT